MRSSSLNRSLPETIEKQGFQCKIVSIAHVKELQKEIETLRKNGLLDKVLYDDYLASFDFEYDRILSGASSLIIISIPQPQVRVAFTREDQAYPVIIPPTYNFLIDAQVADLLVAHLGPTGYRLKKIRLPQKLLAVRSGLAQYGKNNITYVKESGSFYRPVVFISDFPCEADSWEPPTVIEACETCSACMKACPANAIGSDRFLLHAEHCLTYHNESARDFPEWLSPAWHNSLVGCMICQKVCPANKDVVKWIENGTDFDSEETDFILKGVSDDRLPPKTQEKLIRLGMMEYYDVLGRNLKSLIEQQNNRRS